jgi:predicted transcriptional regulator
MPRPWPEVGYAAFQIRVPSFLKRRLVAFAQATGQSQATVVRRALEEYLTRQEEALREVAGLVPVRPG